MKDADGYELDVCTTILPMPPVPEEAWRFIKEAQDAAERASCSTYDEAILFVARLQTQYPRHRLVMVEPV